MKPCYILVVHVLTLFIDDFIGKRKLSDLSPNTNNDDSEEPKGKKSLQSSFILYII